MAKTYTQADRDKGMLALILAGGNQRKAAKELAEQGEHFPHQTLAFWRRNYPERYSELEQKEAPPLALRLAESFENRALALNRLEGKMQERLESHIHLVHPRELAGAVRNVATAKAINTDKAALLRGQPTEIIKNQNPDQILNAITIKLGLK
jgi:hypothetical protein